MEVRGSRPGVVVSICKIKRRQETMKTMRSVSEKVLLLLAVIAGCHGTVVGAGTFKMRQLVTIAACAVQSR